MKTYTFTILKESHKNKTLRDPEPNIYTVTLSESLYQYTLSVEWMQPIKQDIHSRTYANTPEKALERAIGYSIDSGSMYLELEQDEYGKKLPYAIHLDKAHKPVVIKNYMTK
jgi:hypothetical protein